MRFSDSGKFEANREDIYRHFYLVCFLLFMMITISYGIDETYPGAHRSFYFHYLPEAVGLFYCGVILVEAGSGVFGLLVPLALGVGVVILIAGVWIEAWVLVSFLFLGQIGEKLFKRRLSDVERVGG